MPSIGLTTANIMFVYDNVLKCPDVYILDKLCKVYRNKYKDYIDFTNMDTITPEAMMPYIINRPKKNILDWLSLKEFNYDNNYKMLHGKWLDMYEHSPELKMYEVIKRFVRTYYIGNIYVYNPEYDKRQHYDITSNISGVGGKVQYCVGENIQDIIDQISNLHIIYEWDIDRVKTLISSGLNDNLKIFLANYKFNFEEDRFTLKYGLSDSNQIGIFSPFVYNKETKYLG